MEKEEFKELLKKREALVSEIREIRDNLEKQENEKRIIESEIIKTLEVGVLSLSELCDDLKPLIHGEWWTRTALARLADIPVEILEMLSYDKDWVVRYTVAKNLNTPIETLKRLINDGHVKIFWVAVHSIEQRTNLTLNNLKELAKSRYWQVREAVARNQRISIKLLRQLAKDDEEPKVRMAAKFSLNKRRK